MKTIFNVWTRGWSGEWFLMGSAHGSFNEVGDFITSDGIWVCKKSENPDHPAFA